MPFLKDLISFQVDEDEPLFLSLISDLFPGITLDTVSYVELQSAIEIHVDNMGIVNHPPWNLKVKNISCNIIVVVQCDLSSCQEST